MEIERKWLFDMDKVPTYLSQTITKYNQSYLSVNPEVRIRSKQVLNNKENFMSIRIGCTSESYMLCIKGDGTLSRHEIQKEITEKEYRELMEVGNISEDMIIHKQYYTIPIDKYWLTVGIVDKGTENEFSYGEIEFESEEEALNFKAPDWFGQEVTEDKSYKMKNYWARTRLKEYLEEDYHYKLRRLISENPDCKFKFFVSESDSLEYDCTELGITSVDIDYLALYNDEIWLDEEAYTEKLYDTLGEDYEDNEIGNEMLDKAVSKKLDKVNFEKFICVYLG